MLLKIITWLLVAGDGNLRSNKCLGYIYKCILSVFWCFLKPTPCSFFLEIFYRLWPAQASSELFTLQNYWLTLLAMKPSWIGGAKKSDVARQYWSVMAPMLQNMGKKELAVSDLPGIWTWGVKRKAKQRAKDDLSGIWTWGVHISCSLNHWVESVIEVKARNGKRQLQGTNDFSRIWTWGVQRKAK